MNNNIENNNLQNLNNNYQIPQQQVYPQAQITNQEPNKNNKKGLIIGIVIAVIVVIVITSIIFVPKLLKDTNKINNNISNNENHKEITLETLMNAPESSEEDFKVTDYGDGSVVLEEYLGDDEIVVIPGTLGITHIASYTFANDTKIKAIRLSNSVEVLEMGSFGLNKNLEIFVAGKDLREIGPSAFQSCTNLREVILNEGLEKIGSASISGCKNLANIEIPSSVTDIHLMAFYAPANDFTIIGAPGSVAEQHAKDKGINFQAK